MCVTSVYNYISDCINGIRMNISGIHLYHRYQCVSQVSVCIYQVSIFIYFLVSHVEAVMLTRSCGVRLRRLFFSPRQDRDLPTFSQDRDVHFHVRDETKTEIETSQVRDQDLFQD